MTFVDVCLEKSPWMDAARMGVTGGSYGGFMTNWIIGHTDPVPLRRLSAQHFQLGIQIQYHRYWLLF